MTMSYSGVTIDANIKVVNGVGIVEATVKNNNNTDFKLYPGVYMYLYKGTVETSKPYDVWGFIKSKTIPASSSRRFRMFIPAPPGTYSVVLVWNQNNHDVAIDNLGTVTTTVDTYSAQRMIVTAKIDKVVGDTVYVKFIAVNETNGINYVPWLEVYVRKEGTTDWTLRSRHEDPNKFSPAEYRTYTVPAKLPNCGNWEVGWKLGGNPAFGGIKSLGTVSYKCTATKEYVTASEASYIMKYYWKQGTVPDVVKPGETITPTVVVENPTSHYAIVRVKWFDDSTCEKTTEIPPMGKAEFPCNWNVGHMSNHVITFSPKIYVSGSYNQWWYIKELKYIAFVYDPTIPIVKSIDFNVTSGLITSKITVDNLLPFATWYKSDIYLNGNLAGSGTSNTVQPDSTISYIARATAPKTLSSLSVVTYANINGKMIKVDEHSWTSDNLPKELVEYYKTTTNKAKNSILTIVVPESVTINSKVTIKTDIKAGDSGYYTTYVSVDGKLLPANSPVYIREGESAEIKYNTTLTTEGSHTITASLAFGTSKDNVSPIGIVKSASITVTKKPEQKLVVKSWSVSADKTRVSPGDTINLTSIIYWSGPSSAMFRLQINYFGHTLTTDPVWASKSPAVITTSIKIPEGLTKGGTIAVKLLSYS